MDKRIRDSGSQAMTLPDIVIETQKVINIIISAHGEITPEIEDLYQQLTINLISKVDACAFVEKKLASEAEFFKQQAQFYQNISRSLDRSRDNIRERIKGVMIQLNQQEILGNISRFILAKTAKKLIIDETKLPEKYKLTVQTQVPDKEKIMIELEQGVEIEGAQLVENWALKQYANKKG